MRGMLGLMSTRKSSLTRKLTGYHCALLQTNLRERGSSLQTIFYPEFMTDFFWLRCLLTLSLNATRTRLDVYNFLCHPVSICSRHIWNPKTALQQIIGS